MKTPIFEISEPNDVLIFETKEKAERYIEAIDLLNGNCLLVDAEGRLLNASPHKNGSIIIDPNFSEPTYQNELRKVLIDFFKAVGEDKDWVDKAILSELVEKSLAYKTE